MGRFENLHRIWYASDEKFYERAQKFVLLKDTEDKYYTLDEYKKLIEGNQTG